MGKLTATEKENVYHSSMDYQTLIIAFVILVGILLLIWVNGSIRDAVAGMWGTLETDTAKKFFFFAMATLILVIFAGSVAKRGLTIKDILLIEDTPQTQGTEEL